MENFILKDEFGIPKGRLGMAFTNITENDCNNLAKKYSEDTAVLLGKDNFLGDENYIILICRKCRAITIFFRRTSQLRNKPESYVKQQLGVNHIDYLI